MAMLKTEITVFILSSVFSTVFFIAIDLSRQEFYRQSFLVLWLRNPTHQKFFCYFSYLYAARGPVANRSEVMGPTSQSFLVI